MLTDRAKEAIYKSLEEFSKSRRSIEDDIRLREKRRADVYSFLISRDELRTVKLDALKNAIKELWSLNGWHNKDWFIDNRMPLSPEIYKEFVGDLENLLYGESDIKERFRNFKSKSNGCGTAIITEFLHLSEPSKYPLMNAQVKTLLKKLGMTYEDITPPRKTSNRSERFVGYIKLVNEILEEVKRKHPEIDNLLKLESVFWNTGMYDWRELDEEEIEEIEEMEEGELTAPSVWLLATGKNASEWTSWTEESLATMSKIHLNLGDLSQYPSREDINKKIIDNMGEKENHNSLACWQFANEVSIGDIIIAKQGLRIIHGIGIVTGGYEFDDSLTEFKHTLRVNWVKIGPWNLAQKERLPKKTLTYIPKDHWLFQKFNGQIRSIEDSAELGMSSVAIDDEEQIVTENFSFQDAMKDLFLEDKEFKKILDLVKFKKNIVLEGPPGVGKTFIAKRIAYAHMGEVDDSRIEMVQFHQSYSYEDFIQGYRPSEKSNSFERKNGIFYEFCQAAKTRKDKDFFFIIDEINRGNLSKIFGELLMLIEKDKRGPKYKMALTYSTPEDERFFIPENVHIIGTMNTADKSLSLVDYALRRRFSFVPLKPKFKSAKFKEFLKERKVPERVIDKIVRNLSELNDQIGSDRKNLGEGFCIGHSFFTPIDKDHSYDDIWYSLVVDNEIVPLIREYWFDDDEKIENEIDKLVA